MQQSALASRIQREIADQTGLRVVVAEMENTLLLSGRVPTEDDRRRVERIARSLAPERRIDDGLEVERVVAENIEDTVGLNADELSTNEPAQSP
ncbi:MAG TPA: BON domain-containing protein, partial [Ktedonobacterales bacterium]|nr:BON domain-containing protein [Ktedonobacterales bacterium]